ncbi:MAG: hypothetical protein H7326_10920 [Bdellovibrionaceae bacterium]|nr:hypothetical protein [Pseudobdellovibrionaceae bacterium]
MRIQILTFCTLLLSLSALGASLSASIGPTSNLPVYKANWIETKKIVSKITGGETSVQWRQRNVEVLGKSIQVATITSGEIKDTTGRLIPRDLAGAIAKISKIKKWKQETRGAYTAYEAMLPDQAQYMKVFVYKNKDTYKYSIATMRVAFMLPTYFEAELIQREEIGDINGVADMRAPGGKYAALFAAVVPNANAIDFSGIVNYFNGWLGVGQTAAQGVAQAPAAINNLATAGNNGAASINSASVSINGLSATAGASSAELSGAADRFGTKLEKFDKTLQGFQDNSKVAKTALVAGLAGGFGGAAGASIFHYGAQGIAYGAREIYYLITGDLKPEIRAQMGAAGQIAWDSIDALSAEVINMTTQMDLEQQAMKMATGADAMTYDKAKAKIRLLESDLRKLTNRLDNDTDQDRRVKCTQQMGPIEDEIAHLKKFLPILDAQKNGNDVCTSFARKYERWVAIENDIQEARNAILNNTIVVIAKANRELQDSAKVLSSAREEANECDYSVGIKKATRFVGNEDGCICSTRLKSDRCLTACSSLENLQSAQFACNDSAKANKNLDPLEQFQKESALIRNNSESYLRRQQKVADPQGYERLQTNLTMKFAEELKKCPSAPNVVLPIDIQRGQAKAAAAADRPLASGDVGGFPTPNQSSGFTDFLLSPFKKLYRAVTGR